MWKNLAALVLFVEILLIPVGVGIWLNYHKLGIISTQISDISSDKQEKIIAMNLEISTLNKKIIDKDKTISQLQFEISKNSTVNTKTKKQTKTKTIIKWKKCTVY